MKLGLARYHGRRAAGVIDDRAMTWQLLEGAEDLGELGLAELLDGRLDQLTRSSVTVPLADLQLLAPIPRPRRNLICVGKNYVEHAEEFSRSGYDASSAPSENAQPALPIFFTKVPNSVVGPYDVIESHQDLTAELDYEAEMAVVLTRGGRNISREDALAHVGFLTIANDVTARDLQRDHRQWFVGKSLDTFCPMGPWLVSTDEITLEDVIVCCWVNDELRQQAKLSELIFDIPALISTLSAGITLEPGDVILTGTPAGVGISFDPPRFLRPGDTVRVEVSGLGVLSNIIGP